jgi:hypothetical protein
MREGEAAFADCVVKTFDTVETAIGQRFVDEGPKMFGRLQFGTVGGLEDEADTIGEG